MQLKISLFTVPSPPPGPVGLEVPHGTWSIIVTEKNGDRKREKLLFSFLRSMALATGSPRAGESVHNEHVKQIRRFPPGTHTHTHKKKRGLDVKL